VIARKIPAQILEFRVQTLRKATNVSKSRIRKGGKFDSLESRLMGVRLEEIRLKKVVRRKGDTINQGGGVGGGGGGREGVGRCFWWLGIGRFGKREISKKEGPQKDLGEKFVGKDAMVFS